MRPTAADVAWSVCVCLSVGHTREPYKNAGTDRVVVRRVDSGGGGAPIPPLRGARTISRVVSPARPALWNDDAATTGMLINDGPLARY